MEIIEYITTRSGAMLANALDSFKSQCWTMPEHLMVHRSPPDLGVHGSKPFVKQQGHGDCYYFCPMCGGEISDGHNPGCVLMVKE